MKTVKMLGLSIAAIATVGATASYAAPHRGKPHKVCKVVKSHHHAKRVCRWVR